MSDWRPIPPSDPQHLKTVWSECAMELACVCGAQGLIVENEQGQDGIACDCGRRYRLVCQLEVKEP